MIVSFRLEIAWDGVNFVDESAYLLSAQGDMRYVAPYSSIIGGGGITDQASFTLDNSTGRYSPLNTASPLYASISNGGMYMRPVRLDVNTSGSFQRVFTGVLKLPRAQSPTWQESSTVTLDARSRDELLLNRRQSTTAAVFSAWCAAPASEADAIAAFATDGTGISSSDLVLDAGLSAISAVWMDDESVLEECWQLAAASGGRFYATASGQFRYENMAAWQVNARSTTSQQTLAATGENSYQRLEIVYDDADLYNSVTVEATPRTIGKTDVVWSAETTIVVQPGQSHRVTAKYDAPATSLLGVEMQARNAGGVDITSSVSVAATYYAQRALLVFTNTGTQAAYLTRVRILGRPVIAGETQEITRTSAEHGANSAFFAGRVGRERRISGNPYIQSVEQAAMLAQRVLDLSEYPHLRIDAIGCTGAPERRLGDRITIDHSAIGGFASTAMQIYVVGLRWTLDELGFVQDIEGIQTAQMFRYDGEYFVIGQHSATSTRRLFY